MQLQAMDIQDILDGIGGHVCKAQDKHPGFAVEPETPLSLLMEEVGEACKAINEGDPQQAIYELKDAGAVIVRWIGVMEGRMNDGSR